MTNSCEREAPRTRIKVCCIRDVDEARLAVSLGADALGLVGPMPSGPGVIDVDTAAAVAAAAPPSVATFWLTSESTADGIAAELERVRPTCVQIVRHVDPAVHDALADRAPYVRRVQVLHVEGAATADLAREYEARAHALLLDSGRPGAATAELGGTGRVHDWAVSRAIVERSPLPVFLAGGLSPSNVASAIREVRPFGVDLCSGVRREGRLDAELLRAFVAGARA